MVKKIIIFGFPHCGTSILKSIIGHIDEVEEIIDESYLMNTTTDKKYIICKWPFTLDSFFDKEYQDYIKIFIIRNPLYVFSSLNRRFNYNIPENHSINIYIKTINKFIECKNNKNNDYNIYTIKYEDLFCNNYENIKYILDKIGINYNNDIFNNSNYENLHYSHIKVTIEKPLETDHDLFRTWQINQPFVLFNDINKIDLLENQLNDIKNEKKIMDLYPEIKEYVNN